MRLKQDKWLLEKLIGGRFKKLMDLALCNMQGSLKIIIKRMSSFFFHLGTWKHDA